MHEIPTLSLWCGHLLTGAPTTGTLAQEVNQISTLLRFPPSIRNEPKFPKRQKETRVTPRCKKKASGEVLHPC